MSRLRALALVICVFVLPLSAVGTAQGAVVHRTINYGPFTIPAGGGDPHDHDSMGRIENQLLSNIAKPCTNCTIIRFKPDLVYSDGTSANLDTGPMLHHALFTASGSGKSDATCGGTQVGSLGERFFASGNERTPADLSPVPYGYKVGSSENWRLLYDLMNWQTSARTVSIRVTYTYATGGDATARKRVRPVWLDIDQCGDSEFAVPSGESDTHRDWTVTVPGKVIGTAGHIHDHGVFVEATNESTGGTSICRSVAGYGETPGYVTPDGRKHVSSMSSCGGDPLATLTRGQVVRLHAVYNVPETHPPIDDAMGIMLMYVNPS
jgi:hypothetical protein